MKQLSALLLGLALLLGIAAESAQAIPAFARKYRLSCTTCHAPFPRLKAYGDQFAVDGFQLSDEEAPGYHVDTGDSRLNLLRNFPIAARVDIWGMYRSENGGGSDFETPVLMKFLSGGTLSEHLAYYFYFYFDEGGEVAGIDDAFLHFNNLFDQPLDIFVGQYAVSDPLMKAELRLTRENYMMYRRSIGLSNARLSYDRGVMATYDLPTSTGIVAQVINGNGLADASNETWDNDANKNFAVHVAQDIGPLGLTGSFYSGREQPRAMASATETNQTSMIGVMASLGLEKLTATAQWVLRSDSYPTFGTAISATNPATIQDSETMGIVGELIWWPDGDASRWYAAGLYNYIDSEADDGGWSSVAGSLDPIDYHTATLHLGYLLQSNVRLGVETVYDLETEEVRGGLGIIAAF